MAAEPIDLVFTPFTLPTAQHRAGLAGLLVLTESLRRRRLGPRPAIAVGGDGRVGVRLTKESLQVLLDDLYDACWVERRSATKPHGNWLRKVRRGNASPPMKDGGLRRAAYTFETVRPNGAFLQALGIPGPWLTLWREAVWRTVWGIPMTRTPFRQRVAGHPVLVAERVWADLRKARHAREQARPHTVALTGSLLLGAQAATAERVPFVGRAEEAFLLHFWPVVLGVYVPEVIDRKGRTRVEGTVLVVPDVVDPDSFCHSFLETVAQLGPEVAGVRPRGAVISLPQEGGLEYLHHLGRVAIGKAQAGESAYSLAGVEVYHLTPQGKGMHVFAMDHVAASRSLLQDFDAIRGHSRDPLFRCQVLLNRLRGAPWYRGFARVFAEAGSERFVGSQADWFAMDAHRWLVQSIHARRAQ